MSEAHRQVRAALERSRKYRHLCEETLVRVSAWALARHPSVKGATKAAKRKLHQAYGAYFDQGSLGGLGADVRDLPSPDDRSALRASCSRILELHSSSAERMSILEEVYPALWEVTGAPGSVLDLACGYHPFALPFMGLDEAATYHATDIDHRLVRAVEFLLERLGRSGSIRCEDLLVGVPDGRFDVALLLKTLPCLERQEPGIGPALLAAIDARFIVVSFPARSIGGRQKGMRENYDLRMTEIVEALECPVRRISFPTEVFYVLPGSATSDQ